MMKNSISRVLAAATVAISVLTSSHVAQAVTFDFNFSFSNPESFGGGHITGIVRGLTEGTSNATSVEILGNTENFGLGGYIGPPETNTFINLWKVESGAVTHVDFVSYIDNTPGAGSDCCVLYLWFFPPTGAAEGALRLRSNYTPYPEGDLGLRFTPVPLPASGGLLFAAIMGVAGVRRWNKSSA
ncbi:VPLPA-CTERM sorting domain-containing protein [Roseibium album]|uniref:VPLPA-CTERM sorting domain-containing protein n=2 Tax=Roseibium album TaxID=311410 RepID=UPI000CF0EB39